MSETLKKIPSWLKRVQEGSWEPEILISGIVLYGLFNVYPLIGDLNYFLENNSSAIFSGTSVNENISSILKFANIILIIGFITHLLFRSVWAAFVGFSYVYPQGVNFDKLKYPEIYLNHIRKESDYALHIITLEKICSTLFAISFLVFMWLISLVFFLGLTIILIEIARYTIGTDNFEIGFVDDLISIITVIMILDLVSLGAFKRIPYVTKVFYPLYRFSGWITLSFLYRNIYYGLISNNKKWKISLILIFFFVLSFIVMIFLQSSDFTLGRTIALAPDPDSEYRISGDMYRNQVYDGTYSKIMHIEDYIVNKPYLELFIVHTTRFERNWIIPACDYDLKKENEGVSSDSLKMVCLEKFYEVTLDGSAVDKNLVYLRNSKTNQDGLLKIVDISNLHQGQHQIDLFYNFYNEDQDTTYRNNFGQLKFYKAY